MSISWLDSSEPEASFRSCESSGNWVPSSGVALIFSPRPRLARTCVTGFCAIFGCCVERDDSAYLRHIIEAIDAVSA